MLQTNSNSAEKGGIEIDGLRWDAYQGCVYGNPPFDGQHEGRNTIKDTLDQAEKASEKRKSFRAVFFLPLLQAKRLIEGTLVTSERNANYEIPKRFGLIYTR